MTIHAALGSTVAALRARPSALIGTVVFLFSIALGGAVIAAAPLYEPMAAAADPQFGPGGVGNHERFDLPWGRSGWGQTTGSAFSLAGVVALLLLPFFDAVAILAGAGPWPGLLAAWSFALRRAGALLALQLLSIAWLMALQWIWHDLLGAGAQAVGRRAESETVGLLWWVVPEVGLILMAMPIHLALDLARGAVCCEGRSIGGALRRALGSLRHAGPWVIWAASVVVDLLLVGGAAWVRPLWDPERTAWLPLAALAIVAVAGLRVVVQVVALGALARWQRGV